MKHYFVTRHAGAVAWAKAQGLGDYELVTHATPAFIDSLKPHDVVAGTLPVDIAARVCSKGASYMHLSLQLPAEARGKELTAEDMTAYGACLVKYAIVTPR